MDQWVFQSGGIVEAGWKHAKLDAEVADPSVCLNTGEIAPHDSSGEWVFPYVIKWRRGRDLNPR